MNHLESQSLAAFVSPTTTNTKAVSTTGQLARVVGSGVFWAVMIFIVALLTRWLFMSVPLDIDEGMWIRRGPLFILALLRGDWPGTYLRHHPGVTNMWLSGGALSLRYAVGQLLAPGAATGPNDNMAGYLSAIGNALPGAPLWAYVTVRAASAIVTAGCLAGIYLLSRRLFGQGVALIAAAILLFEPFFVAYQRSITTDANETNFTWLALLAFLLYGRAVLEGGRRWTWLLVSGVCYGLALLSKVSALLSLPVFGFWIIWVAWSLRGQRLRLAWPRLLAELATWGIVLGATVLIAWPALWTGFGNTLTRMATDLNDEIDGHYQFFLGQTTLAPGPGFYPVVMAFRLSPFLVFGSTVGIASLLWPRLRHHLPYAPALWAILADVAIVTLGLTSQASKIDRYIVPVIPGLALLAAAGIWASVTAYAERGGQTRSSAGVATNTLTVLWGVLGVILVMQLAVFVPHYPTLLTYYNPLLGGPPGARRALMVGNGELLDRAAAWLNQQPGSAGATAATWYTGSFAPYFQGRTVELTRDPGTGLWPLADAQYAVIYVNQFQRQQPPEVLHYYAVQRPLYTAQAHGLDYARVYPGPAASFSEAQAKSVQPAGLDFGGYARLLGYEIQTPEMPAGGTAVVNLYWQPIAPFPASDYTVYVGVQGPGGQYYGKADNGPVGGMLPVILWRPGQVIRDAQQVRILPGTPPGDYRLEVGFYSQQLGQMLPIRSAYGPRGTQVPLASVRVTRPSSLPDGADLGIAHMLPPNQSPVVDNTRLLGYEWPEQRQLQAGGAVPLTLLWRAAASSLPDTQIYLELVDGERTWERSEGHPLGGNYPPDQWTDGELVRDSWVGLLPADAPARQYGLKVIARSSVGEAVLLDLGQVELETRTHNFTPPKPAVTQAAQLGNLGRLVGYDLPEAIAPGKPITLTLYWQAEGAAERNYVRFVHLLGDGDQIVAQADGPPGSAPATSWVAGESIVDQSQLVIPGELHDGAYRIAIGLYDPASGERLKDPAGQDRVLLSRPMHVRRGTQ